MRKTGDKKEFLSRFQIMYAFLTNFVSNSFTEEKSIPVNEDFFERYSYLKDPSCFSAWYCIVHWNTVGIFYIVHWNTVLKAVVAVIIEASVTVHYYFCALPTFFTQW